VSSLCDRLDDFVDGELTLEERARFLAHLDECPTCSRAVDERLMLEGALEEALELGGPLVAGRPRPARARLPTPPLVMAIGALAAVVALVLFRPWSRPERRPIVAGLEHRSLEFRVGPPEMDVHAAYDPHLGSSRAALRPSYSELAELEGRGRKALVARLLQMGDLTAAKELLDGAREDTSLENERGVLALMGGRPQEALDHLPESSSSSQTRWNRALALRELHLPHAAATTFEALAKSRENGWSAEAADKARGVIAQASRAERDYDGLLAEGRALVADQKAPSQAMLLGQRDFVRLFLYDAVRAAGTDGELRQLRPIATSLDAVYGGEVLTRYVDRIAASDLGRRKPLALRYRAFAEKRWRDLDPDSFHAYLGELRRAGLGDLLIGALLASRAALQAPAEFVRLARAERDPWMDLAAEEVRAQDPRLPMPEKERLLREAIQRAASEGFELRRMRLERVLVELLIHQHRSLEALAILADLRARARRLDDLTMDRLAVWKLVTVTFYRRQRSLLQAYATEVLSWEDYPCQNRREVITFLAQDALMAGELDVARAQLRAIPACEGMPNVDIGIAWLYSEIAKVGGASDRELLRGYVARSDARGEVQTPAAALALKVLEHRVLPRGDSSARRALLDDIEKLDALPGDDEDRDKSRLIAYQALALDAIDDGKYDVAFELLARERRTPAPAGCSLGLLVEDVGRVGAVWRDSSGNWAGAAQPRRGGMEGAVSEHVKARLEGCPQVAVVAEPPFHSRSDLLGPRVAWSFHEGAGTAASRAKGFTRHVVISDVETPPALQLSPLPHWQAPASPPIQVHLTGASATPARTLAALADADLVQFHVHGLRDAAVADAAFLPLAPGEDGNYALTAAQIRRAKLARHPIVILAACDAAEAEVDYTPTWSLPVAFLQSGARAVLAASSQIPSRSARDFFAELLPKLEAGEPPVTALRDLRLQYLERGATWVRNVVLFE